MCSFCTEFLGKSMRIIESDEAWILLPTVGCFVPGYCLFMPIDHVRSFATLHEEELMDAKKRVESYREMIAKEFMTPVIVAEHGPSAQSLGAACCDHAHLHLIPMETPHEVLQAYMSVGGPGRQLSGLQGLKDYEGQDYVYLSVSATSHFVWPAAAFSRQFVRKVCARLSGVQDVWNWREHPYLEQGQQTLYRLRPHVSGVINGPGPEATL